MLSKRSSLPEPLISIIIPIRDQWKLLKNCLESIHEITAYSNYEIIIINNSSKEQETFELLRIIEEKSNIHILNYDHRFNFSAINNYAEKKANGEVLLFLNNDTTVIASGWLTEMAALAIQPDVGAVGALLRYPNGNIQHAGVVMKGGLFPTHKYLNWKWEDFKNDEDAFRVQEYPAVTGACMAIEKKKFLEVGGFDEKHLPIAFNDIDLCLKLLEKGYKNLFTPYAQLYHYESASRGYEDTLLKKLRFRREIHYMQRKWGSLLESDQFRHQYSDD